MNIKRAISHLLRHPYYYQERMREEDFRHLEADKTLGRVEMVVALVYALGGQDIIEVGGGKRPLTRYLKDSIKACVSVDPLFSSAVYADSNGVFLAEIPIGIEDYVTEGTEDTLVIVGLGYPMGKAAYQAIDRLLEQPSIKNFILESSMSWISDIYTRRVVKAALKAGFHRVMVAYLEYPREIRYWRRLLGTWRKP